MKTWTQIALRSFLLISIALAPAGSALAKKKRARAASAAHVEHKNDAKTAGLSERGPEVQSDLGKKLSDRLAKIVASSGFKNGDLGLWVGRNTEEGLETLYGHNYDKLFIPASLSKLITLGAVLHELQPGYKYKTQLLSDAAIKDGVLTGPLYLKGGGDPSFVSENMWFLVNELTRAGVTSVEGDIVVDDSRFDTVRFGTDRQKERVDRAYDAPIGAMSMNWNSVAVYIRPGDKLGDKLKVFVDVMSPYIKVRNETKTVVAGRGQTVSVERNTNKKNGDEIVVSGAMAIGHPETVFYKSITEPDQFAGSNLVEFLKQRGISVKGAVRAGVTPVQATVLAVAESKPLRAVVADMAKWSNNYVAEMLVKNLAAESGLLPGTMEAGLSRVRSYLESIGFKKDEYEFINAAGFTRENKLSPVQIGRFLETIHGDFTSFPEYLSALPIAGIDGTLRSRMKSSAAERWVRAKTGLLNGVVGLAGFAGRPNGGIVTFAFIYNGGGKEDRARGLFDRLAAALVEE